MELNVLHNADMFLFSNGDVVIRCPIIIEDCDYLKIYYDNGEKYTRKTDFNVFHSCAYLEKGFSMYMKGDING